MRKLRHELVFALGVALVLLLVGLVAGCAGEEKEPAELRIGLIAPLSNPAPFTAHRLAEARVAELNEQGGLEVAGRRIPVRLIVADSGGSIENTMNALTRLIQQERVSAIIGPYFSREAIPVAAAVESLRVPMITPSATNPEVTKGRQFAFRVCQLDSDQGQNMAQYAFETLGLRRLAVLYDEADAYSSGLAGYFRAALLTRSGAEVLLEPYQSGQQDYLPQLSRIRQFGAQGLFLPNFPVDLGPQLQQARLAGFKGIFLGSDSWDSDHAFHSLPEAQGAMFTTDFFVGAADPALLASVLVLASKAGVVLDQNHAATLDTLDLFLAAARNAGSTDPVSLRSGLASIRDHRGLTGTLAFSNGGDPLRSSSLVSISGGGLTLRARLTPTRQ
jgi:branched-chain amino acid transport system substrate-binding protein